MSEGKAMIVVGIEEEIDPLLDPVMVKEITKRDAPTILQWLIK